MRAPLRDVKGVRYVHSRSMIEVAPRVACWYEYVVLFICDGWVHFFTFVILVGRRRQIDGYHLITGTRNTRRRHRRQICLECLGGGGVFLDGRSRSLGFFMGLYAHFLGYFATAQQKRRGADKRSLLSYYKIQTSEGRERPASF